MTALRAEMTGLKFLTALRAENTPNKKTLKQAWRYIKYDRIKVPDSTPC